jgi:hypothetical protein
MGMGRRTGRAAGYCAGYGVPGYANAVPGRGFGMGFGRGRGWRNMFYATGQPGWMRAGTYAAPYPAFDPEMETQALKNQAQILKSQLDAIEKRISEIKGGSAE